MFIMNPYAIPNIVGSLCFLVLGVFVYLNGPNERVNKAFALMCTSGFIWLFIYGISYLSATKEMAFVLLKIGYVGVIFIPATMYHFMVVFLKLQDRKILTLSYCLATFFAIMHILTPFFMTDVYKYFWGYYPKVGILHPFYLTYLVIIIWRGIILLILSLRRKDPGSLVSRNQTKYVLAAMLLWFFAGEDFIQNYNVEIYPFGFIFILGFFIMVAYAIVRHKLMDIEVVLRKTLVFAGLFASIFGILLLPTLFIQECLIRRYNIAGRAIGMTISGIIIILSMRRLENFLVNVTDKYLFQKKYDYKELLKTFTAEVLTVLKLDDLISLTVSKLDDIVKLNSCAVLLMDEEKQQFTVMAQRNITDPHVTLIRPDGIVTFLEQTHGYLLVKELREKKISIPLSIQEIIDNLNAELIIPMVLHSEVIGILSFGRKKSDEDYTQEDLDILLPLARTLAIAISNARLFDELGKTQAEAAQREKMAVIGTLSAGINHEICNPLGIARGQCEAFLLNIKDGLYQTKGSDELLEKAKEIMVKVMHETDRATAITKKLSSFAKPSKGEAESINVDREINEVLGLVGYELKLEKIDVDKRIAKNLPPLYVDRKQFQEVLFNLIRNAGQAIGERGRIIISAAELRGRILIDIQDTGSGIPQDKIRELFNPFFTTKGPDKGTGLGLFIVRQIVEKNCGRIYLKETKVGEGTTFRLEFPVLLNEEARVKNA